MCDEYQNKRQELEGSWWNWQKLEDEPKQENKDDCGVVVCTTAQHILNYGPLDFTKADMVVARKHIVMTSICLGEFDIQRRPASDKHVL